MAPGDVCHGPRCSLAGLGPVALEYRSCHWPGGSAGSPQCVRPMGYWFFPVPRPPYVCAVSWAAWLLFTGVPARFAVLRLRCPGPLGSCSPVRSLGVLCCAAAWGCAGVQQRGAAQGCSSVGLRYGMVWYGMVWYGMVWYGMVWYGMVCCCCCCCCEGTQHVPAGEIARHALPGQGVREQSAGVTLAGRVPTTTEGGGGAMSGGGVRAQGGGRSHLSVLPWSPPPLRGGG